MPTVRTIAQSRITRNVPFATRQKKPRVCAYARVSSALDGQENSFDNQVRIYTERITNNPAWEFAGIYADKFMSGTTDKRPEYQRLMADCEAGKIDIVLVKSISRFARNVLITVESVRKLKSLGVTIIFEKENIDTSQAYSEMLLTILAAFSQEESRNISDRVRKGLYMRAMNGDIRWKPLYGYTKIGEDEYIIVDEEADVVRWIFNKFLESRTIEEVMTSLYEEKGISIPKPTISDMLKNVKYAGDVVTVKRYVINHLTHSVTINRGEHEQVLIEDHHEAIVDRELFQRVQEKRQRRFMGAKFIQYPFGSLPKCPYCGEVLHRRRCLYRDLNGVWICNDENCGKFAVLSKDLEQAAVNAYNASNQNVGEITQAEKWWVDRLVESLTIETCETGTYLTVKWKNGESNKVEIPIDKETPEYILEKERSFKIRHGIEV